MTAYEPVIGLEVHAQMHSRTKLFCGCPTDYGAPPNEHTCPVCLGLPGALPVPNRKAIELAVQAGLALGCDVAPHSRFARKNYFYPDLAKGYQISQFELPLNGKGHLDIEVDGETKRIGITRIHVEEDAAKNLHGVGSGAVTLVDFNRAGTPLVEIVSEPDLRSADEAEAYLKKLRDILMFIGVNDGNLEEGSFRCDANVSIRPVGQEELGTRAELKNINSFRFVKKAIDHEIARQEAVLQGGGEVVQETRTWVEAQNKTVSMRGKEEAHDYRYFPDPDLPPLAVAEKRIEALREALPELPKAKRARWQKDLGLTAYDAGVLSAHPEVAKYFEEAAEELTRRAGKMKSGEAGKKIGNFIQSEVLRHVSTDGLAATFPVAPAAVAELLTVVEDGTINGKIAKKVFATMVNTGKSAQTIIEEEGLAQVTDAGAIEDQVRRVLEANPSQVEQYRGGKTGVLGFFVGQVMKATRGAANPKVVNETLKRLLDAP
ncbi:MAG: Asp-tRNA(Asn)/Glu-tRNA(Gln) amidotransferase subunit GatB [Deltaproteobacteria bacterium]|nr:Asp-tRNA(Asn)/Glu-tRNA(Gln) amidotransferase subunit GatB [Deltaproteobacteria bacterium]